MKSNGILLCCVWNGKHDCMVGGGGLAWELNAWYGMWILLVKEFQGKLLVMVVSVYLDIGDFYIKEGILNSNNYSRSHRVQ